MSENSNSSSLRLNVLPNSGKLEDLKKNPPVVSAKPQAASVSAGGLSPQRELEIKVIAALRTVFDPELPVNIYDLGLIYSIDIDPENWAVQIEMTLTAPGCPVAGTLPGEVQKRVQAVPGVSAAAVELVWEPAWSKDRMSEEAMLDLGLM